MHSHGRNRRLDVRVHSRSLCAPLREAWVLFTTNSASLCEILCVPLRLNFIFKSHSKRHERSKYSLPARLPSTPTPPSSVRLVSAEASVEQSIESTERSANKATRAPSVCRDVGSRSESHISPACNAARSNQLD